EIRLALRFRQIEDRGDRDLDASPRDPDAVVGLWERPALDRDEEGLREPGLHRTDLGVAQDLLVPSQHLAGHGVVELVALAEDRELLTDLGSAALAEIQIDRAPLDADHETLERAERLGEVVEHEREGCPDAIGHPGGRARDVRDHGQYDEADGGPDPRVQNVTDGRWMPNTPRRRSHISPRVAPPSPPASPAATRSGRRLSRPRAAVSRPSSARPAASRSRVARVRATRSARAPPMAGSTWKRLPGGWSSVTYSLTPTTIRAWSSTSR